MLLFFIAAGVQAEPRSAIIIDTELTPQSVRIHAITDEHIVVNLGGDRARNVSLERCLAVLLAGSDESGAGLLHADVSPDRAAGQLLLADGQRYIGTLLADADVPEDVVPWSHPTLGQLAFKLDDVRGVILPAKDDAASVRPRLPEPDIADVVVLRNGDELHGFILSINDPIVIKLAEENQNGADRIVELPRDRVASLSMISPRRTATGMRLWLSDGTIMDVQSLTMPEGGDLDATGRWHGSGTQTLSLPRRDVAAILVDTERLVPLSSLAPMRVIGPETRYRVSDPVPTDAFPLLGVSRIEYRGPVTAYYALPEGTVRFATEAILPSQSRALGDFELIIRIDGATVQHHTINADTPTASINIPVDGSELTIELREGESGPVQNHLVLSGAMLLLSQ